MKKMVLVVAGCVVLIGVVFLIGRERAQKEITTEYTEYTETGEVRREGLTTKGTNYTKVESEKSEKSADGQTGKSAPRLSEAVKALLGQDGKKHNYPSLLKAINALNADMSAADVAALREMLDFSNDRFPEKMRPIEINAVKNDVLDKLLRQKQLPEGLGLQMVEMAGNAENDPVWRDYCIQFMQPFYERVAGGSVGHGAGSVEQAFQPAHQEGGQTGKSAPQDELSAIHNAMFSEKGVSPEWHLVKPR